VSETSSAQDPSDETKDILVVLAYAIAIPQAMPNQASGLVASEAREFSTMLNVGYFQNIQLRIVSPFHPNRPNKPAGNMSVSRHTNAIELRVDEIAQLFNVLDPFPFRERDLDRDAEEYIVSWAQELPRDQPITIVIHAPARELETERARHLRDALSNYFEYRAEAVSLDLNELFRIGRRSLAIGMSVLAACIILARMTVLAIGSGNISRFAEESLVILGWVANWRPLQIFLYDWWPLARRRNLYRRLAAAEVDLRPVDS
jgi:hypothetical protein